jgi:hypothetical protein
MAFIEVDIKPIINISFVGEKNKKQQQEQKKRFSQCCPSVSKCCVRERIERIFLWYYSLVRRAYWVYLEFGFVRVFSCHL